MFKRIILLGIVASSVFITTSASAAALCANCVYTKAPVYGKVTEEVLIRPARTISTYVPSRYETYEERVLVSPERTVKRVIPGQYQTSTSLVQVTPARKYWQVGYDTFGHIRGWWETMPARYVQEPREIGNKRPVVVYEKVPAVYKTRMRTVKVRSARTVRVKEAPVYAVRERTIIVEPSGIRYKQAPLLLTY